MNEAFSSVLEAPQVTARPTATKPQATLLSGDQRLRPHFIPRAFVSAFVFNSTPHLDPDPYAQREPEEGLKSNQQLTNLQRSYTLLSDGPAITDALEDVPALYPLLNDAVQHLRLVFGETSLLQLEALSSEDETFLRVMVKVSRTVERPAELMRKFKLDWWFQNCSRSEAALIFDYEMVNEF